MPRTNREYLLRFCDQALNDIDRAMEKLKFMSDMYAGKEVKIEGSPLPETAPDEQGYNVPYGKYIQWIDLQGELLQTIKDNLTIFKQNYM